MDNIQLNAVDRQLIDQLAAFLPARIFDAHLHLYDAAFLPGMHDPDSNMYSKARLAIDDYLKDQGVLFPGTKKVRLNIITMPDAAMADRKNGLRDASVRFLAEQLTLGPDHVGEAFVLPDDDECCVFTGHPRICGSNAPPGGRTKPTAAGSGVSAGSACGSRRKRACISAHGPRSGARRCRNRAYSSKWRKYYPRHPDPDHAAAFCRLDNVESVAGLYTIWFDLAICDRPPTRPFSNSRNERVLGLIPLNGARRRSPS